MASYQNPNGSADSLPPSPLNWGDSLDPQDEPPSGHAAAPPYTAPATPTPTPTPLPPPTGPAVPGPVHVRHAIQPHPHVPPQPYSPPPPPLYDVVPPGYSPSGSYRAESYPSGGQSFGYAADVYARPPTPVPFGAPAPMPPSPTTPPAVSRKAKAALWIGILGGWLPINLFVALAALAETGPGRKRGRDRAVVGLCCSLVWVVLVGGITYAVRQQRIETPPPIPRRGAQAASADPGCWAGANAVFAYQGTAGDAAARTTLGDALIDAAGKSRIADAALRRLGLDYLVLAQGSEIGTLAADTAAVGRICGLSFKVN